jgi:acyl-coenzyme A synthetase/AMP-(fatty) acid ligase
MPQNNRDSLWNSLNAAGDLSGRFVFSAEGSIALNDLVEGSTLYSRGDELLGRSVLIATTSQLTAASALIELDGIARRIVLYPPDLPLEHLPFVVDAAEIDAVVCDRTPLELATRRITYFMPCSRKVTPGTCNRSAQFETEWVLLTSGTTGLPKMVVHSLSSLAGAIPQDNASTAKPIWSTFYDIRRYGGLQIFLRAVLTGTSFVLSDAQESMADFLARAGSHGVTHISGTPTHWRSALMSPSAHLLRPEYVRLSGEIADQGILNHLHAFYSQARIGHAFASTEAGVAFDVNDGLAGFPESVINHTPNVEMKVADFSLRIRSKRTASRYLGDHAPILKDEDGFVDTSDMLELRDGRYYFIGRRDGVINVGGLKVYPEEVEAVLNRHPSIQMSLVRMKKSAITGALVVADVVLKAELQSANHDMREIQQNILLFCREALPPHKVPAAINFVPALAIAETGKLMRRDA